jgi:hypothetical protein
MNEIGAFVLFTYCLDLLQTLLAVYTITTGNFRTQLC